MKNPKFTLNGNIIRKYNFYQASLEKNIFEKKYSNSIKNCLGILNCATISCPKYLAFNVIVN